MMVTNGYLINQRRHSKLINITTYPHGYVVNILAFFSFNKKYCILKYFSYIWLM